MGPADNQSFCIKKKGYRGQLSICHSWDLNSSQNGFCILEFNHLLSWLFSISWKKGWSRHHVYFTQPFSGSFSQFLDASSLPSLGFCCKSQHVRHSSEARPPAAEASLPTPGNLDGLWPMTHCASPQGWLPCLESGQTLKCNWHSRAPAGSGRGRVCTLAQLLPFSCPAFPTLLSGLSWKPCLHKSLAHKVLS